MNSVEKVKAICKQRKIPISKLERDLGFSNAYISQLKKGTFPSDRLVKIAEYLNVSLDELLEEQPKEISFDDFTYAFYNESKDLTDENKQKLLELARFFKEQQEKEK